MAQAWVGGGMVHSSAGGGRVALQRCGWGWVGAVGVGGERGDVGGGLVRSKRVTVLGGGGRGREGCGARHRYLGRGCGGQCPAASNVSHNWSFQLESRLALQGDRSWGSGEVDVPLV